MSTFEQFGRYYDAIYYNEAVYKAESEFIIGLIEKYRLTDNNKLLDIACGTGTHFKFFIPRFEMSGLDLSSEMLSAARERYPDIPFYQADMSDFHLDEKFGAVICLYGSIGFLRTAGDLRRAVRLFSLHLERGGVLILTPWSSREDFRDVIVSDQTAADGLQIARMENVKRTESGTVDICYHYLIGEKGEIHYYTGHHPLITLVTLNEYEEALRQAGLVILEVYRGEAVQMGIAYICRK